MGSEAVAAFASWRIDAGLICALLITAWIYLRGWRQLRGRYTTGRLASFLGGLAVLFIALDSPLDAFGNLLLEIHMIQHLLLIMVIPPLLWYGQPMLAMMRGLPAGWLKHGLGPFLGWHGLQRVGRAITHPVVCWLALSAALIGWHLPGPYELALRSQGWHEVEHACFLFASMLFWWPVIQVWPSRPRWPRWSMIPYLVAADLVNTGLSAVLSFADHAIYPTYQAAPRLWGISAVEDQSISGAIMWVPGSIAFLLPALMLTMQLLDGSRRSKRPGLVHIARPARVANKPTLSPRWLGRFRVIAQCLMLLLAVAVVVDGLAGPQLAPLNLAGVLPWIHWRGLAVIALLTAGNLFCMVCPFTLPRTLARRFFPPRYNWPRQLRSKWLAAGLIVIFFWAYEAFRLWNNPWWTAWIIVGYFAGSFFIDSLFQGASFCKYVCPIGQFHFVQSLVSPFEVKVREPQICRSCTTHDCLQGNQQQRGCELHLFQPTKAGNFDCTFCLDCVQSCPTSNVAILPVAPASSLLRNDHLHKRTDVVALALMLVFGAFLMAAMMTSPVMMWTHQFGPPLTILIYVVGLVGLPAATIFLCGAPARDVSGRLALALVPLGLGMWVAHFSFHLFSSWQSIFPVVDRILSRPVIAASAANVAWLPSFEILSLDFGLMLTLYVLWKVASRCRTEFRAALTVVAPWALLAIALYAVGIWTMFQPMEMRGMVMG